jgi:hypothetical protein
MNLIRARLLAFHRDTRGAIAILVLLMIWCLVGIIGLVWNTIEESRQRAAVQTAADSAAHAAAAWMARTGNAINAQNMVICQDASAEAVWRGITPTNQALTARLDGEVALALQMKQQQGLVAQQRRIQAQIQQIANDNQLILDALANLRTGSGANFATPAEQITFFNQLRQADSARRWVMDTYMNGAAPPVLDPGAPPRPGPPGPNGEGLVRVVNNWQPTAGEDAILDYIINFIMTQEKPIQAAFQTRTAPAAAQPLDQIMAAHQASVYATQLAMVQELAAAVEAQRQQLADFYRCDITLATLRNSPGNAGPAAVMAPYVPASAILPVNGYVDSIRARYAAQAAAAGLPPSITIDGISPHTDQSNVTGQITDKAQIWHPGIIVNVPVSLSSLYPGLAASYNVSAAFPGGWGHLFAMPLERYFQQRVQADLQEHNQAYMVPLDQARSVTLAQAIRQMLGVPNNGNVNIADLPGTIPDDQAEPYIPPVVPPGQTAPPPPPPRYDPLFVLPRLTAPANASAAYRAQVDLYNTHGARLTGDVRSLRTMISSYAQYFQRFITPFAANAWQTSVNVGAAEVLLNLGQRRQFMVLSTYGLRPIPDWARPGMYDSAVANIENQVLTIAMLTVASSITRDLVASNPAGGGGGILDPAYLQTVLTGQYAGQGAQVADALIRPAAHQIAVEIASEWVSRPWAYEITPPSLPVPPSRGMIPYERKAEFSLLAAARQTDATAPRLILPAIFGGDTTPLVAYAQGEMFNWMEFNDTYGAQPYDQITRAPEIVYRISTANFNNFVGAPRGWRVASMGGWEWRARLSLSDALTPFTDPVRGINFDALQQNSEFRQYLLDSGISNFDSGAINELNLH